ncbi:MAG: hypothetical protein AAF502_11200 [Bacteroidota bacterium]
MSEKSTSMLINDLTNVPNIISSLGLGVAAAQKAFNLEYLQSIEQLFALAKMLRSKDDADAYKEILNDIVKTMAPSRYQFTETTLTVRMDLAQSLQQGTSAGLGMSVGAVTINAAFTQGFAYDYRAAAEVKTVLHAINFDANAMNVLLEKAKTLNEKTLTVPKRLDVDKAYMDKSADLYKKLTDADPAEITEEA